MSAVLKSELTQVLVASIQAELSKKAAGCDECQFQDYENNHWTAYYTRLGREGFRLVALELADHLFTPGQVSPAFQELAEESISEALFDAEHNPPEYSYNDLGDY